MCIICAENGHISSDSFFLFHYWQSHFFHLDVFSVENNNSYSNWLISDPSMSHFENTILDGIFLFLSQYSLGVQRTDEI